MSSKSFNDQASLYTECGKIMTDMVNSMELCWQESKGDPLQGHYDDEGKIAARIAPLETSLLTQLENDGSTGAKHLHSMLDTLKKHNGTMVEGVKADYDAYMADYRDFSSAHKELLGAVPELAERHVPFDKWLTALQQDAQEAHATRDAAQLKLGS